MLTYVAGDLADGVRRNDAWQRRRRIRDAEQQPRKPWRDVDVVDEEAAVLEPAEADGSSQQDDSQVGRGACHVARGDEEDSRE